MEKGNSPLAPPDGGYGWFIVLSVFLQISCVGPIMPMFGLLFGSKFEEFETTPTEQTSIFAVYLLTWNIITMFVGPLVQLQSERFVAFLGSTVIIIGLVLCAFSTSTLGFMLAYGLGVGSGMGLVNANGVLIISKFFKKKIGLAYGLYATGVGIGAFPLPQLVKFLLLTFSGKQTILIYAAINSVAYIGAILQRDVRPLMKPMTEEDFKLVEPKKISQIEKDLENGKKAKVKKEEKTCLERFIITRVFLMIEWKLLRDPFFLMVAVGNSVCYCVLLSYVSSFRTICQERDLSVSQTADIITIISATEILTRGFQGFLGDRACLRNTFENPKKSIMTFMALAMSVVFIGISFTTDFMSLAISVCICSLFTSAIMINGPLIYKECFPDNLPSALGLSNLIRGGMAIILGPIVGMLKTHFGTFNAALYFLAGITASCMGLWALIDFIQWRRSRR